MTDLARAFREEERYLFAVCYRMTGCAADAEDLVQQTFARAMESPPSDESRSIRPWLVRVAMNQARDLLRRRKVRGYVGPWLPSPIETDDDALEPLAEDDTEARYDALESVSFAFLLALEALTPKQRAVLVLRDVLGYSVREAAEALAITETNAKVVHHRARKAMEAYDAKRRPITGEVREENRAVFMAFLQALAAQDVAAVERVLAADACALSDGGGEYLAARVPVEGAAKVAFFHLKLARRGAGEARYVMKTMNGLPALVVDLPPGKPSEAPRIVIACEVGGDGKITRVYSAMASRKLTAVPA